MLWLDEIRERHMRRFFQAFLLVLFLLANWGHTIEGIYHIILSARAAFYDTVDGELAEAIGYSTLSFGKTATFAITAIGSYLIICRFLEWFDYDAVYRDDEVAELKRENQTLINNLRTANTDLALLSQSIEHIASNNQILAKQQDRVVELAVELEKLALKTKQKPVADKSEDKPEVDTIGLFEPVQKKSNGKGSSSFRRRPRPNPKF